MWFLWVSPRTQRSLGLGLGWGLGLGMGLSLSLCELLCESAHQCDQLLGLLMLQLPFWLQLEPQDGLLSESTQQSLMRPAHFHFH